MTFRAENIAPGASSFDMLKSPIPRGATLRCLSDLPAKIITSADTCFVGNYSLTSVALRYKEVTLATAWPASNGGLGLDRGSLGENASSD